MVDPDHVITLKSVIVNYEKDSHSFLAQSVFSHPKKSSSKYHNQSFTCCHN